jgi:ABC-type transporter MlaC component
MRDVISLYPRFLVFSAIMAAFLLAVALVPGANNANATAISSPVQTTATETSERVQADECRIDQHAYAPTCTMRGRTVRVIKF